MRDAKAKEGTVGQRSRMDGWMDGEDGEGGQTHPLAHAQGSMAQF